MILELKIKNKFIKENKTLFNGISNILGIGVYHRYELLKRLGFNPNLFIKIKHFNYFHEKLLLFFIFSFTLERDLLRLLYFNIKKLSEIKSIFGMRHNKFLPIFGRTRTNGRTCKVISKFLSNNFKRLL